ncbi:diphthine--ammonia ligase [Fictibacillus terranigra]|uniref:Diphthine--ammonia ligase n=1 Tax=Fictibacillus terranigra TaxID=3058424 RepID=A0ABT8E8T2_9BACL|nr:diphthine--ammonia ligase [Fictibacillus sp. CENA-BCM004]MDN4074316.1 diphthine--ammonia ligase [Fictibacillus sp. CENA-BCM004]
MAKRWALSWSGGKDACMVLDQLVKQGEEVVCLMTTLPKETSRTFGHGESKELIQAQADALGIPLEWIPCSFDSYTENFISELNSFKRKYELDGVAFGDLYLAEHRQWGENVAKQAALEAIYPLWMKKEEALLALKNFVESGYRAKIIRVSNGFLDEKWLGREIDTSFLNDIQETGICPMGEAGEYHSYVYSGPLFRYRVPVKSGEILELETTKRMELSLQ